MGEQWTPGECVPIGTPWNDRIRSTTHRAMLGSGPAVTPSPWWRSDDVLRLLRFTKRVWWTMGFVSGFALAVIVDLLGWWPW